MHELPLPQPCLRCVVLYSGRTTRRYTPLSSLIETEDDIFLLYLRKRILYYRIGGTSGNIAETRKVFLNHCLNLMFNVLVKGTTSWNRSINIRFTGIRPSVKKCDCLSRRETAASKLASRHGHNICCI